MSNAIEKLLSDYTDLEPFARQFNRHPRTVRRWMTEPDGLPFTRVGNRALISTSPRPPSGSCRECADRTRRGRRRGAAPADAAAEWLPTRLLSGESSVKTKRVIYIGAEPDSSDERKCAAMVRLFEGEW